MIDPLPIFLKYKDLNIFDGIGNVTFSEDAKITIDKPEEDKYNICYQSEITGLTKEIWVRSSAYKISLQKSGITIPIIVLTEDESLLPYCMKDRLATLQDRINKKLIDV